MKLPRATEIVRLSSGEQAALYMRELIFDGHLHPGSRVPQDEIAHALGVSRIPVREALIALEREGWVTVEIHRGAFINAIDEEVVRDHYELLGLAYGFAAQRALTRGTDEEVDELIDQLIEIEERTAACERPRQLQRLSDAFHTTIVEAAQSPRIKVVRRAMADLVPGNVFALVEGADEAEQRGQSAILRAMKRGDGDRASEEYRRLMRRMAELVIPLFAERGLFDELDEHEPEHDEHEDEHDAHVLIDEERA
jgi:DNA-binding GntR family transcriptional regulator